jgi:aspartate aminotransferase-like enzyme
VNLENTLSAIHPEIDPEGLLEYSVVFTDRSLNHMSERFQGVMNDISAGLKTVYHADAVAIVPGGGTFAMEAVARQFATGKPVVVLRNGWFSFRWSQILEMGQITDQISILKAYQTSDATQAPFAPAPLESVLAEIAEKKPAVVFAPHVETSSGMLLPDDYVRTVAEAVHGIGGIMVLDCIASGALWVDMKSTGVDVLISAPQKGWSASPCAGLVMLSDRALQLAKTTTSTSFACDLGKWLDIMQAYENGAHAYHATMPTDGLTKFRDTLKETEAFGFDKARAAQLELGQKVRNLIAQFGFASVAAEGFEAPGVVVSYTDNAEIQSGRRFLKEGMQVAAGVPLQCDEPESFSTFRVGLFGLDKLKNVDRTVDNLQHALQQVTSSS